MIRILIADDQPSVRFALQEQLKSFADIEIVGVAEDGRQAVKQASKLLPDVLLLDLSMPVLDGYGAAQEIKDRLPQIKILVFTSQNEPSALLPALKAGAHGYLLKGTPPEDLANAIRAVQKGHFQIGPGIVSPTDNAFTQSQQPELQRARESGAIALAGTGLLQDKNGSNRNGLSSGSLGLVKAERGALAEKTGAALATFDRPVLLQQSPIWSRVIIWGLVGSTAAIVAWACLFKFDEAIPAIGQLEPIGAVKEVQSPVAGVVKSILVKDGQKVKKGESLLLLDPQGSRSEVASLQRIKQSLLAENAFYRQQTQSSSSSSIVSVPGTLVSSQFLALAQNRNALIAETQFYRAEANGGEGSASLNPELRNRLRFSRREETSRENAARLDREQLQKQLQQVTIQQASAQKSLESIQKILEKIKPVVASGGLAQIEQIKQEESEQKAQAEIDRLQEEYKRISLAINQANEKLDNTVSLSTKDVLKTISENEKQIAQINSQFAKVLVENEKQVAEIDNKLNQANMTLTYQKVLAPSDGVIFDLKPKAPGFVANTTEPVLKIVPSDSLVAKVFITNRDIGFVKTGMPVDVRIDSFPFSEYGDIKGTLTWIGSDALPPTQVRNYYSFPATVKLTTQTLSTQQKPISLQSGMSLNVNIKTRQRTVMSIFTDLFTGEAENLKHLR
jgi:hemolysin D